QIPLVGRIARLEYDGARERVTSLVRRLRTAQDFETLRVPHRHLRDVLLKAFLQYAIDGDCRGLAVAAGRAVEGNAPNSEAGTRTDIRHATHGFLHRLHARRFELITGANADARSGIELGALELLARDDDATELDVGVTRNVLRED